MFRRFNITWLLLMVSSQLIHASFKLTLFQSPLAITANSTPPDGLYQRLSFRRAPAEVSSPCQSPQVLFWVLRRCHCSDIFKFLAFFKRVYLWSCTVALNSLKYYWVQLFVAFGTDWIPFLFWIVDSFTCFFLSEPFNFHFILGRFWSVVFCLSFAGAA